MDIDYDLYKQFFDKICQSIGIGFCFGFCIGCLLCLLAYECDKRRKKDE